MAGLLKNSAEPSVVLERPQFCLRTLMLSVTLCGVLFATMSALGGLWSVMLILFLSLAAAHVFGNALGTKLRDASDHQKHRRSDCRSAPGSTAI
jgi:hypothetical protein